MILLRDAREKAGLSQKRLSEMSKVPQQTISAIESGERKNPGVETLLPLARAMGCLVDDLIAEDSDDKTEAV